MSYDKEAFRASVEALIAARPVSDYEIVKGIIDTIKAALGSGVRITDLHEAARAHGFRGNCAKFADILVRMGLYKKKRGRRRDMDNYDFLEDAPEDASDASAGAMHASRVPDGAPAALASESGRKRMESVPAAHVRQDGPRRWGGRHRDDSEPLFGGDESDSPCVEGMTEGNAALEAILHRSGARTEFRKD